MTDTIFQQQGFIVIKNLINTTGFYQYLNKLNSEGASLQDTQVTGSKVFYKDWVFEKLLERLIPNVEQFTGCKVYKTYSFARIYELGNELEIHTDRDACQFTLSISLGYEGLPWPLWLLDKNNSKHSFILESGDALLFKGIDHHHWRDKNVFGPCSQVFLHYVDQAGPYAIQKDDNSNA